MGHFFYSCLDGNELTDTVTSYSNFCKHSNIMMGRENKKQEHHAVNNPIFDNELNVFYSTSDSCFLTSFQFPKKAGATLVHDLCFVSVCQ